MTEQIVTYAHRITDAVCILAINVIGQVDSLSQDIRGEMYRVVYWNDGSRHVEWLYAWEIKAIADRKAGGA